LSTTTQKLSRRILFFFGLSEMPIQVAAVPVTAYIVNFYVDDIGLSAALVGTAYMLARLFDVITDPAIGFLTDRTRSRWGRRRPWMLAGMPIMWVGSYMLFFPSGEISVWYFFIWMAVLWLGWTMLLIPYYAWAAELSPDYNERSTVTSWRTALGLVANIVSKLIPSVAVTFYAVSGTPAIVELIGMCLLVILPISVILTVTQVPESDDFVPATMPLVAGMRIMMKNGPFKRLISAFFINYIGTAVSTATIIFFVRGVLHEESAGIIILLAYYITSLCSIPFWLWLSKRIGKHRTWITGLLGFSCIQPLYLLLGPGDIWWMSPIIAATGFFGGTFHTMTNSMKADVIDLDTLKSGENRAGMFFAMWSMAMKVALAFGPAFALWMLGGFGYVAGTTDPDALLALRLVYALSVPVFFTAAAIIVWGYPITEERHLRMRRALERRQSRRHAKSDTAPAE
jgi:GPH family glycoside/pentoside/hexuronide:cation symporter